MDFQRYIKRELSLPKEQSFFLFGARQTGKTSLVKASFPEKSVQEYNLFLSEQYARFVARPNLLREEVEAIKGSVTHVFIDEVQRVPELLNEVQYLMDSDAGPKFILTGSSARKLKRGRGNLLAGRAWSHNLFPLTYQELIDPPALPLLLSYGSLPANITASGINAKQENLRAYVDVYLKEEIEAEALSRNIGGFIRFLDVAAQMNGELINYSNIARDVGLSDVTVKEYFKILEDTLIGSFLLPFARSERKKHKLSPKFYFFDTGVLRALQKRMTLEIAPQTFEFGNYFETWIINEVHRISSYQRKDLSLSFLRTANDVEVDLVICFPDGHVLGVEIKSKETPQESDFVAGFKALRMLVPQAECVCVCPAKRPRKVGQWDVLPFEKLFELVRDR
jgi:predicted AAA+ superfamily ATPase